MFLQSVSPRDCGPAFQVLKLVGLTLRFYFKDWFNCFDFVIVAISIVEIMPFMNSGTGVSLTALRSFRVLRVFKVSFMGTQLRLLNLHSLPCVRDARCTSRCRLWWHQGADGVVGVSGVDSKYRLLALRVRPR